MALYNCIQAFHVSCGLFVIIAKPALSLFAKDCDGSLILLCISW